jgi:hypothetical protein
MTFTNKSPSLDVIITGTRYASICQVTALAMIRVMEKPVNGVNISALR